MNRGEEYGYAGEFWSLIVIVGLPMLVLLIITELFR